MRSRSGKCFLVFCNDFLDTLLFLFRELPLNLNTVDAEYLSVIPQIG